MKLLVVDSEPVYQEIVSWCAESKGLATRVAASFQDALMVYEQWQPDIITMDTVINGGSAFELVEKIKQLAGDRFVPVLFLSSKIDDLTMNHSFRCGGDDFIPKPFNEVLFNTRLGTHLKHVLLTQEMYKKNRALMFYRNKTELEHNMAHKVLAHAQRRSDENDKSICVTRLSATTFNGDIALVKKRQDGARLIFVGDFTGHGLAASIGALPVTQVFFDAVEHGNSLEVLASELNRVLFEVLPDYMFCAGYLLLIGVTGDVQYWGGGMPNAFHIKASGEIGQFASQHMPLGVLSEGEFEQYTSRLLLEKGDSLVIATDGAHELKNPQGVMLQLIGLEKIMHTVYGKGRDMVSASDDDHKQLVSMLKQYQGDQMQLDDITVISISG